MMKEETMPSKFSYNDALKKAKKNHSLRGAGETQTKRIEKISIESIAPNPYQPRKSFDEDKLIELSNSIKQNGLLQNIVVAQEEGSQRYTLIAGERRLRASKIAGLNNITAVVFTLKPDTAKKELMTLSLVENIHRDDLLPIDEAESLKMILEENSLTVKELASLVSKTYQHVYDLLPLNELSDEIKEKIRNGMKISIRVLKEISAIEDKDKQLLMLETIHEQNLNRNEALQEIKQGGNNKSNTKKKKNNSIKRSFSVGKYELGDKRLLIDIKRKVPEEIMEDILKYIKERLENKS